MRSDLIKRLRDALYFKQVCTHPRVTRPTAENNWLSVCNDCGEKNHLTLTFGQDRERAREIAALIAEADAYLASGGWVRVDEALPVVPEGEHAVAIAVFNGADVIRTYWQAQKTSFVGNYSHWRPDPLPQPPEQTK